MAAEGLRDRIVALREQQSPEVNGELVQAIRDYSVAQPEWPQVPYAILMADSYPMQSRYTAFYSGDSAGFIPLESSRREDDRTFAAYVYAATGEIVRGGTNAEGGEPQKGVLAEDEVVLMLNVDELNARVLLDQYKENAVPDKEVTDSMRVLREIAGTQPFFTGEASQVPKKQSRFHR